MRRLLFTSCVALLAGLSLASAGAAAGPPTAMDLAPNMPGAIIVPVPLEHPPSQPETRSPRELLSLWRSAGGRYRVPWQVLAAVNKIESNFGRNMGPSSAGAVGWMQFLPSTWLRWGIDGNGDGLADPWNPDDAVYAAARYLAAAGGEADIRRALFAYNHAEWYVDEVLAVASVIDRDPTLLEASAPSGVIYFDERSASAAPQLPAHARARALSETRRRAAVLSRVVRRLQAKADRLSWRVAAAEVAAGDPRASARRFHRLEHRLARFAAERKTVVHDLQTRARELDRALARLSGLKAQESAVLQTVTFTEGDSPALGSGSYTFPVGGGAGIVAVSHYHHDYPAADIVAPAGSPVYAFADATVVAAFTNASGRCGIGLELVVASGERYVYCHLEGLVPGLVPGAALPSGELVGWVGSTGHATGPHLHLQLDPALRYPQSEPWFESFAGRAFHWLDDTTPAASPAPVFTIIGQSG